MSSQFRMKDLSPEVITLKNISRSKLYRRRKCSKHGKEINPFVFSEVDGFCNFSGLELGDGASDRYTLGMVS